MAVTPSCPQCVIHLIEYLGTSLVVLWLRLCCASYGGSVGLIPSQGTKIHTTEHIHNIKKNWIFSRDSASKLDLQFAVAMWTSYGHSDVIRWVLWQSPNFSLKVSCSVLTVPSSPLPVVWSMDGPLAFHLGTRGCGPNLGESRTKRHRSPSPWELCGEKPASQVYSASLCSFTWEAEKILFPPSVCSFQSLYCSQFEF